MMFVIYCMLVGVSMGGSAVASNPSPFFGPLGLILVAGSGCGLVLHAGGGFLSIILVLIYLGGMLVVFAYCAALVREPDPETWGEWSIFGYVLAYINIGFWSMVWFWAGWDNTFMLMMGEVAEFELIAGDAGGVATVYSLGAGLLMLAVWILLLALFMVLELAKGKGKGGFREVK
uniref:NADH-ubiquinone oxidoreductase chain 6 n=1 Tax=Muraenolepis orangiensis TaxID=630683 RepID=A0A6M4AFU6_9TELE|nr:NADH dehydrogenase subunit 6 [Muraenolepis orangiensis]